MWYIPRIERQVPYSSSYNFDYRASSHNHPTTIKHHIQRINPRGPAVSFKTQCVGQISSLSRIQESSPCMPQPPWTARWSPRLTTTKLSKGIFMYTLWAPMCYYKTARWLMLGWISSLQRMWQTGARYMELARVILTIMAVLLIRRSSPSLTPILIALGRYDTKTVSTSLCFLHLLEWMTPRTYYVVQDGADVIVGRCLLLQYHHWQYVAPAI